MVAISAGDGHSLALMGDGTVRAWGYNSQGQLGNNSITNSGTPVFVDGLSGIVAIAGGFQASLALQSEAIGTSWGENTYGGLGNAGKQQRPDRRGHALSGLTAVSAGGFHSVGLRADGTVWTWGDNRYGEMGIGAGLTGGSTPTQIMVGGPAVKAVATGEHHSLALTSTGAVYAWGNNENGQTGVGTVDAEGWVTDLQRQLSARPGKRHRRPGGGRCGRGLPQPGSGRWRHRVGLGREQLRAVGNSPDPYTNRSAPAQVLRRRILSGVVAIAGGAWHSLALKSDGTVWAWGATTR